MLSWIRSQPEEPDIDLIDLQFYNEDSELILDWVEAAENQEDPLLDEAGDPQCPSHFINRWKIPLDYNVVGVKQHRVKLLEELQTPNDHNRPPSVQRQRGRK